MKNPPSRGMGDLNEIQSDRNGANLRVLTDNDRLMVEGCSRELAVLRSPQL